MQIQYVNAIANVYFNAHRLKMPKRGYGWTMQGSKTSRKQAKKRFYAVAIGRRPGIYDTWDHTHKQVHRFRGAKHKSFKHLEDAFVYMYQNRICPPAERTFFPHMTETPRPPPQIAEAERAFWMQRENTVHG